MIISRGSSSFDFPWEKSCALPSRTDRENVKGSVRRVDGEVWKEEDREIVYSHEVFRFGASSLGLLQEEASGLSGLNPLSFFKVFSFSFLQV